MTGLGNDIFGKSEALVSRSAFSRQEYGVLHHTAFQCAGGDGLRQLIYTEVVKRPQQGEAWGFRGLAAKEVRPLDLCESDAGFLSDVIDLSTEYKHLKKISLE